MHYILLGLDAVSPNLQACIKSASCLFLIWLCTSLSVIADHGSILLLQSGVDLSRCYRPLHLIQGASIFCFLSRPSYIVRLFTELSSLLFVAYQDHGTLPS